MDIDIYVYNLKELKNFVGSAFSKEDSLMVFYNVGGGGIYVVVSGVSSKLGKVLRFLLHVGSYYYGSDTVRNEVERVLKELESWLRREGFSNVIVDRGN